MVLANNVSSKLKFGGNILDSGKRVEEGLKIMWNSGVIGLNQETLNAEGMSFQPIVLGKYIYPFATSELLFRVI